MAWSEGSITEEEMEEFARQYDGIYLAREVLELVEWGGNDSEGWSWCPACRGYEPGIHTVLTGHHEGCKLAKALDALRRTTPPPSCASS